LRNLLCFGKIQDFLDFSNLADETYAKCIPKQLEKSGICQGGALNLSQAKPSPKQLNLNKLSDADGFQIQWLSDVGRNRFFKLFRYIGEEASFEKARKDEF
jgi:hypothetical protein